ncbi:MAG: hypothetical protein CVU64_01025 [Deltaproteobacteria bacterium HGW-Deltaproteobacteria-21]|jgi:hypothetical protein|nr:MAG: hypothetical protein CVU64_01025 [Deltaproteobacteria bacterium HGW-Deltaproteobacteria-21]
MAEIKFDQFVSGLDEYSVKARLRPALLIALPLLFATLSLFPAGITGLSTIVSLFVWAGASILLSQMGREWGKRKEPGLYADWGGQPSIRMLRHRDAANKRILARYHAKLERLIPDVRIPTAEMEKDDPKGADDVYDACCAFLRAKTRDRKVFPLIFEENVNYGFRRNLWGMRPLGIIASLSGIVVIGTVVIVHYISDPSIPRLLCLYGIIDALLLLSWLLVFNKAWVKTAADAYASRLLEGCEIL